MYTHFNHLEEKDLRENKDLLDLLEKDFDKIVRKINELLDSNYPLLLVYLSYNSMGCLTDSGLLPIYDWVSDECPWDSSGELEIEDYADPSKITLYDFLYSCYTGDKEATYESGCGWNWLYYSEYLSTYLRDFAFYYLTLVLEKYIPELWDNNIYDWLNEVFYEASKAYSYFSFSEYDDQIIKEKDLNMSVSDFLNLFDYFVEDHPSLLENKGILDYSSFATCLNKETNNDY